MPVNGDIPVFRSMLSQGEAGVDETVAKMVDMAKGQYGARSAKIRALAINILDRANVGYKDYYGQIIAVGQWVRDNIRYVKDPIGQETLSYPEETAFNSKAGDCDDMSILVMALLGSIGIRSYPVVVGQMPGAYSHVYVYAEVPPGKHRYAGSVIAVDAIMREWAIGREVPQDKIRAKKTYSDLAGDLMSINGYAEGPSYLNEAQSRQVKRALDTTIVNAGGYGEVFTAPKVDVEGSDIDGIFTQQPQEEIAPASGDTLFNLGPVTAAGAAGTTKFLPHEKRTYQSSGMTPMTRIRAGRKVVEVSAEMPYEVGRPTKPSGGKSKATAPSGDELAGLNDYLGALAAEIAHSGCAGWGGLSGPKDPLFRVAAASTYARQRYRKAKVAADRFLPGLGEDPTSARTTKARSLAALARQIAVAARQLAASAAGNSRERRAALTDALDVLEKMDRAGAVEMVDAEEMPSLTWMQIPHAKVEALAEVASRPFVGSPDGRGPLLTPVANGSVIRDHTGRQIATDLAGWGSKIRGAISKATGTVKKAVKKAVKAVVKTPQQVAKEAKQAASQANAAKLRQAASDAAAYAKKQGYSSYEAMVKATAAAREKALAAAKTVPKSVAKAAVQVTKPVAQAAKAVQTAAKQTVAEVKRTPTNVRSTTSGAAQAVKTAMSQAAGATKAAMSQAAGAVQTAGSQAAGAVRTAGSQAGAFTRDTYARTGGMLRDARTAAIMTAAGGLMAAGILKKPQMAEDEGGETQYLDADGNPISEAEYNRLMAEAEAAEAAAGEETYVDADGNPISKEEYDRQMAEYNQWLADQAAAQDTSLTDPGMYPSVDEGTDTGVDSSTYDQTYDQPTPSDAEGAFDYGSEEIGPAEEMEFATDDSGIDYGGGGGEASWDASSWADEGSSWADDSGWGEENLITADDSWEPQDQSVFFSDEAEGSELVDEEEEEGSPELMDESELTEEEQFSEDEEGSPELMDESELTEEEQFSEDEGVVTDEETEELSEEGDDTDLVEDEEAVAVEGLGSFSTGGMIPLMLLGLGIFALNRRKR